MRALLPCPDLCSWLPLQLAELEAVGVAAARVPPRPLESLLQRWPALHWPLSRDETAGLSALVRVHGFDDSPLDDFAPLLDPGALLVDIALAPKRPLAVLLGIADDGPRALREAESVSLALMQPAWVERRVYAAHDPVRAVVSTARRGGRR